MLRFCPQSAKPGHEDYAAAVHDFLRRQFEGFSGDAKIIVSSETIGVEWGPASKAESPVDAAIAKLTAGNLVQGIVMLELWRGQRLEDVHVLYNLGAAYSDLGHLDHAVTCLEKAVALAPDHVNACIGWRSLVAVKERTTRPSPCWSRRLPTTPRTRGRRGIWVSACSRRGKPNGRAYVSNGPQSWPRRTRQSSLGWPKRTKPKDGARTPMGLSAPYSRSTSSAISLRKRAWAVVPGRREVQEPLGRDRAA